MIRVHHRRLIMPALLAAFWCRPAIANVMVRFDPPSTIANLNDTFSVDVVADFTAPILGWGLDVNVVDDTIATQITGFCVGGPCIGVDWAPGFAPDGDQLTGLAFPFGVSGNGVVLATLHFSADQIGETDILASVSGGDQTEGFALDPTGFDTVAFTPGHIKVVPEPAALACLALALLPIRRGKSV